MGYIARCNGVVPLRVKGIALNVEGGHLGGGDLDPLLVSVGVQFALDRQAGRCGGSGDQVDHGEAAGQGMATPVLRASSSCWARAESWASLTAPRQVWSMRLA